MPRWMTGLLVLTSLCACSEDPPTTQQECFELRVPSACAQLARDAGGDVDLYERACLLAALQKRPFTDHEAAWSACWHVADASPNEAGFIAWRYLACRAGHPSRCGDLPGWKGHQPFPGTAEPRTREPTMPPDLRGQTSATN